MGNKEKNKETGNLGERIASKFLESKGFCITERNYKRKTGEIDIIAEKEGTTHFVEVKSISRENISDSSRYEGYRPEELVHSEKLARISKTAEFYMFSREKEGSAQIDVVTVELNYAKKTARCTLIPHVEP